MNKKQKLLSVAETILYFLDERAISVRDQAMDGSGKVPQFIEYEDAENITDDLATLLEEKLFGEDIEVDDE